MSVRRSGVRPLERLDDPDEGLVLREEFRERLLVQVREVAEGDRGRDFNEVCRELGFAEPQS